MRALIELDDFRTDKNLIRNTYELQKAGVELRLFALLGLCNTDILRDIHSDFEICLHGWNHFVEKTWGYWEMRHFLEFAEYAGISLSYKPPWNRFPKPKIIQAMKEKGCELITPKKVQFILARFIGLRASYSEAPVIHPVDFLHFDDLLEKLLLSESRNPYKEDKCLF